nr:helix-turn-helix transcriptional regulator [uncultured Draconibacterium sp.]
MDNKPFDNKELGKMIHEARVRQGLTQEDLAGMSGVGRRVVSEVERGKETAQIGKVLLILAALGIGLYAFSKWKK